MRPGPRHAVLLVTFDRVETVLCGEARINDLCREDKRKIADLVKQIVSAGDQRREVGS